MTTDSTFRSIPGGDALVKWFEGLPAFHNDQGTPSFHDAEIARLDLDRSGPGKLILHLVVSGEHRADGQFALHKACTVTFGLFDVFDMDLKGFGQQNVIGSLAISQRSFTDREMVTLPGSLGGPGYEIKIEPCWGVSGTIRCRSLAIEFAVEDLAD